MFRLLTTLTFFLALASVAYTQPPKGEPKYASMPWHLADTWWDLGQATAFESLAVDVTISDDVPADVNLYIAPIGLGHLSKTPFYGGIQTHADGNTKKDTKLRDLGPGLLFSMWGERSLDAIRPSDGGFLQSSGHEGDFVSVRRPYAWKKGKYTYRLTKMDREEVDGKAYTWVGAFVYSHAKDENVFVGALRFKGEKLELDRKVANFVEVYGKERPVADIPKVTVTFGPPVVNGKAAKVVSAEAIYPKGVPDYADVAAKDGSLVVTVGRLVEGREKRRVTLIDAKAKPAEPKAFPGAPTKWNGFAKHDFKVGELDATVVVPEKPLPGRPWVWRGEFFGAFAEADVALVKVGWHLAYLQVPDLFGSPKAVKKWEEFHVAMVKDYGLHDKPGLIGLSRGGLYCMNWAAVHPDKTLAVYLDNAVCDFKSWPGGEPKKLGKGKGSEAEWKKLLAAYDFKSDADAIAYKFNPVDNLEPLAKAKLPLLLVYGDKDAVVPHAENSELVYERYKKLGGPVEQIVKPGQDHHPHGLKDVTPVVKFFTDALGKK